MKKVVEGIAPSVTNIYIKRCIETGNWPAIWKRGELTPNFKKGDKHNEKNDQPITTVMATDKVFESFRVFVNKCLAALVVVVVTLFILELLIAQNN